MSSKKSAQAPAPTPAPAPAPATTQTNGENGSQELARLTDHAAICTLINGVSSAAAKGFDHVYAQLGGMKRQLDRIETAIQPKSCPFCSMDHEGTKCFKYPTAMERHNRLMVLHRCQW